MYFISMFSYLHCRVLIYFHWCHDPGCKKATPEVLDAQAIILARWCTSMILKRHVCLNLKLSKFYQSFLLFCSWPWCPHPHTQLQRACWLSYQRFTKKSCLHTFWQYSASKPMASAHKPNPLVVYLGTATEITLRKAQNSDSIPTNFQLQVAVTYSLLDTTQQYTARIRFLQYNHCASLL